MMSPPLGSALVTGASSGIGAVHADRPARRGHDLVLVARDGAKLDALMERLAGTGRVIETLPPDKAMPVGLMVDAALAGLDLGEPVTIPALDDPGLHRSFEAARLAMGPHLSRARPAERCRSDDASAA